ncbi:hypothetical protein MPAN_010600 [Mariniplasma anaerobium]|uniref:Carbohydrate esterase 2 N-terminal domain-containing protein n=2 Tax=Mariniplasma anaerobium TaxID=2735436 RepID=A0A7U9XX21_9MOLU|nr:hypothetical protein MPAN_010600 [Mariniplasma anaerobium]
MAFLLVGCETINPIDPIAPEEKLTLLEGSNLDSEYIYWYGRHQEIEDSQYFYYTATGFKANFTGRVVDITLSLEDKNNDIYFSVSKDGSDLLDDEVIILSEATQSFRFSFDTYGDHEIKIIKRSEPEDGITSLVSLETNGSFNEIVDLESDAPHFLIMGASGISGHGALGYPGQPRTTENSSSLHSFGYLSASHFNGTYEFVSNSGWGLAFGYNDTSGENNIYKAYDAIGIDSNQDIIDVTYDHQMIPDVIIINVGGNDYSAVINRLSGFEKDQKIQEFKAMVAAFILKLREDAPEAHIFWTMTDGSLNGTAATQVINLLDPDDLACVHVVVIKQVGDDGDLAGAHNHASYITHQKSADLIIEAINLYTNIQ